MRPHVTHTQHCTARKEARCTIQRTEHMMSPSRGRMIDDGGPTSYSISSAAPPTTCFSGGVRSRLRALMLSISLFISASCASTWSAEAAAAAGAMLLRFRISLPLFPAGAIHAPVPVPRGNPDAAGGPAAASFRSMASSLCKKSIGPDAGSFRGRLSPDLTDATRCIGNGGVAGIVRTLPASSGRDGKCGCCRRQEGQTEVVREKGKKERTMITTHSHTRHKERTGCGSKHAELPHARSHAQVTERPHTHQAGSI